MKLTIKGFIYHKAAESYVDCFDRYAVNVSNNRFAIADGVSKSFFPGIWAELIVEKFVSVKRTENSTNKNTQELLADCQKEWFDKVAAIVNKPGQKYFVRNHFNRGEGAAATFVGLEFIERNGRGVEWRSYALGDSFLFFVPDEISLDDPEDFERGIDSNPSIKDKEFDNFPDFFESRGRDKGSLNSFPNKSKSLKPGVFYLMTDALAEWFFNEKGEAVKRINNWNSQADFKASINELRKTKLHNDDSAILIIKVEYNKEEPLKPLDYSNPEITMISDLIAEEEKREELKKESEEIPEDGLRKEACKEMDVEREGAGEDPSFSEKINKDTDEHPARESQDGRLIEESEEIPSDIEATMPAEVNNEKEVEGITAVNTDTEKINELNLQKKEGEKEGNNESKRPCPEFENIFNKM